MSNELVFKQMEHALINAQSEEHAVSLLSSLNNNDLSALQKYLQVYTRSKSRVNITKAIVERTYTSVRRSQIIRQIRPK